jgi:hypothetical protein
MLFNNRRSYTVSRKGKDNIYATNVNIQGYEEISRRNVGEEDSPQMFLDFYDQLKKRGRVLNCRYKSLRAEFLPAIADLISKNGKKPDKIIVSNIKTYFKIKETTEFVNQSIFDTIDNSDNIFVFSEPTIEKQFIIFTYSAVDEIGINLTYDDENYEWVLETPIYRDASYNDSHYNYYYGLKLHD